MRWVGVMNKVRISPEEIIALLISPFPLEHDSAAAEERNLIFFLTLHHEFRIALVQYEAKKMVRVPKIDMILVR